MKVIDLLNKIANGEEVPKRIIYDKSTYWYNGLEKDYYKYTTKDFDDEDIEYLFDYKITEILNDEVEIIEEYKEENKIPEKIEEEEIKISLAIGEQICANKINEIIDYLDYLKSKGDE